MALRPFRFAGVFFFVVEPMSPKMAIGGMRRTTMVESAAKALQHDRVVGDVYGDE